MTPSCTPVHSEAILPPEAQLGGLAILDYLTELFRASAAPAIPPRDIVRVLALVRQDPDFFSLAVIAVHEASKAAVELRALPQQEGLIS